MTVRVDPDLRAPRFAHAALETYATQLGVAVLSFASVLIAARALGPEGRGELALLTTMAVLTSSVGLLGIDEANVNLAGSEPRLRRALATNSLILSALFGGICIATVTIAVAFVPALAGGTDASLRWVAYAAVPALILKVLLKFLAGADYAFRVANAAWLLPPGVTVIVNAALAVAGQLTVARAFVVWAVAHGVATLLLALWVAFRSVGFGRPSYVVARKTLAFGVRAHPGRVMMAGNYRVDQWIVGSVAGTRELGLYSIAVAWSEVLFYLPTAIVIAQRPYLVRSERSEAARRAAGVFRASVVVTAGLAAAVVVAAPVLCTTVFGEEFSGSVDDLRVLVVGACGIVALKLLGNALTAQRLPLRSTTAAGVAFVATIVLNVLLVPPFGGLGAAAASALAYTAGGAAIVVFFLHSFDARASSLVPRPRDVPAAARLMLRAPRAAFARRG